MTLILDFSDQNLRGRQSALARVRLKSLEDTGMGYEECQAAFHQLVTEYRSDSLISPTSSEADTRAKFITRILTQTLDWPEPAISREQHSAVGYLDYVLGFPQPGLVVEAKRAGKYFVFPKEKRRSQYALVSLRTEGTKIAKAIHQVRNYCDATGIEYACITNGAQWILFRAISTGVPWSAGKAFVFRSLEDIQSRFVEFWNLLSYDVVREGALAKNFDEGIADRLEYQRPLDGVAYSDGKLQRNPLSYQLQPLIQAVFRDLTGEEEAQVLRRCYVFDRKVEGVWREVRELFSDRIPAFAKRAGFMDLIETEERSGALDDDFRKAVSRGDFGTTILLLGGIGSGKTTFVHRFFRVTAKDFVDQHCVWAYIPFTEAPPDRGQFGAFVRARIRTALRDRYAVLDFESLPTLRRIYRAELESRRQGVWAELEPRDLSRKESEYLESLIDRPEHCDAMLRHLRSIGLVVTLVLDNVDQRDPDEQLSVFLLAHELCRSFDAVVIVALREESFFRAEQAGAFNAYHNIRYHIASPEARRLLAKRIDFALEVSAEGTEAMRVALRSGVEFNSQQIRDFLGIVKDSVLRRNPAICQFIDAVSQGNMRSALDMFNQFLISGTTNVAKMLAIFNEQGWYRVAEHEFIKAVMLGDFQFYRGSKSRILNLFEVSPAPRASNLTSLRILRYLNRHVAHAHPEGRGFIPIDELTGRMAEVFGRTGDVEFHLRRLVEAKLLETDNRQVDSLVSAQHVRITSCGIYYLKTLSSRFQYLDGACLDTPIWHARAQSEIRQRLQVTDLYERIGRVEWFLGYLELEEERSLQIVPRMLAEQLLATNVVRDLRRSSRVDLSRVVRNAKLDQSRVTQIQQETASLLHSSRREAAPAILLSDDESQ
jgi:hypothetical protein